MVPKTFILAFELSTEYYDMLKLSFGEHLRELAPSGYRKPHRNIRPPGLLFKIFDCLHDHQIGSSMNFAIMALLPPAFLTLHQPIPPRYS